MANVTLNVTDAKGAKTGTVEAPAEIFGFSAEEVRAHVPLIHQVVVAQRAAAHQGTHAVSSPLLVRALTPPRPAPMFPAAARSRGSRRAPVAHVRARFALRSGTTAVSCSVLSRAITPSAPRRR